MSHCLYQLPHVSKGNSHLQRRLHLLLTSGRASDKLRKELLFFMEIQSSLMLGSKDPSTMVSDRLSDAPHICSGKHTHFRVST